MAQATVVILDEEPGQNLGLHLQSILQDESDYQIDMVQSRYQLRRQFSRTMAAIVLPVLPSSPSAASELLSYLLEVTVPMLPVLRADPDTEPTNDLMSLTDDFLVTPFREAEVRIRVRKIIRPESAATNEIGDGQIHQAFGLAQLIGESPAFQALKQRIALAARYESTIFLFGETGTGKERCARALHYLSGRAGKPFIPVNCGAVPADLFESELYGHQKGAFTGAVSTHPGLIAEAEGGTLFLDEVETLSLASQVKLLRFLQDQTYHSLGCAKTKHADVWIIASSNVDLLEKAKEGTFREDLFYRLAVITLALPALRDRRADIPLLADHFLRLHGQRHGKHKRRFSVEAMDALRSYSWPGNVRELENVIQQIIVFTDSDLIGRDDIPVPHSAAPEPVTANGCFKRCKARMIDEFERSYVSDLLRTYNGNVTHAAMAAKMDRRAFGRLIKKHQIEKHLT